ncbi:hypothetical protein GF339_17385 [candidate division KSB3 bacterium]|uniref:Uncharacterized protein n=1 Tax=candidate division KSB3 bacterium TaxID=2044937 RepID=A0A9D5JYX7_9BACT|nr:hypothetical protein [candidate division KSB3 bacterium]MBD3326362.1 hypothetical protein [candidate division KSB3 bacterium]
MDQYEDRLKILESEIISLRRSFEKYISSSSNSFSTGKKDQTKLLDLFGAWDGEVDDFLHDLYERRERRGRGE